ncbi:G-protein coupled receptor [Armadillidium vulgare]|nr:G-protein coupled receptor [Armadillidium vulgare]
MALVWVLVLLVAAIPLAPIEFFADFYGRSGVCLALHITNEKPNGWQYAVFVFIVLNFISFAVIAISYVLMYTAARTTQTAARDVDKSSSSMGKRMTLIVVTDAACWLPIIGLGIASLCGATVQPKVYAWVAVFVLPLNAAINPVLYTLSTAPVRKGLKRVGTPILSRAGRYSSRHDPLVASVSCSQWKSSFKSRLTTIADNETAVTHIPAGHKMSLTYKTSLKDDSIMEPPSDDDWVKLPEQCPDLTDELEEQRRTKSKMYLTDKQPLNDSSKHEELVPLKVLSQLNQEERNIQ